MHCKFTIGIAPHVFLANLATGDWTIKQLHEPLLLYVNSKIKYLLTELEFVSWLCYCISLIRPYTYEIVYLNTLIQQQTCLVNILGLLLTSEKHSSFYFDTCNISFRVKRTGDRYDCHLILTIILFFA